MKGLRMMASVALVLGLSLSSSSCTEMSQILQSGAATAGQPDEAALSRAVKECLELGSSRAADLLSKAGGYQNSSRYRIRLPQALQPIAGRLRQFGLGGQVARIEAVTHQGHGTT